MSRVSPAALSVLLLVAGCEQLQDVKDTLEGLTNPLVVEALVLGVAEPESEDIDLTDTPFEKGTVATVFLADATGLDDLEESTVAGAQVAVRSATMGTVDLVDEGAGLYAGTGEDGLLYTVGEDTVISVIIADETHTVAVQAPQPASITVQEQHEPGANLLVDLTAYEYDAVLVAVVDLGSGEVTYSNEPQGIREIYDFTHTTEPVRRHEIPGSAFAAQSVYAVGVAGMRAASADDYTDMNTGLSSYLVGQMRFFPVRTVTAP